MDETKLTLKYTKSKPQCTCCKQCRHANQETDDFADGLIYCKLSNNIKGDQQICDVAFSNMLAFEEYDGTNYTWDKDGCFLITYKYKEE